MYQNFEGCPILIYDENGTCIAKTIIMTFDRGQMSIGIPVETEAITRGAHLIIMIVHPNGVTKYNGIAREALYTREISLFKERHRQGRSKSRFIINAPATIEKTITNLIPKKLSVPQHVSIINISQAGILIRALSKCFDISTILEVNLNVGGENTLLHAQIIRESSNGDDTSDYGCKFVKNPRVIDIKKYPHLSNNSI